MEAPVEMLINAERVLTRALRIRRPAVAGHDNFQEVLRALTANHAQAPKETRPAPACRRGRNDQPLPGVESVADFDQVAEPAESEGAQNSAAIEEGEIDQTTHDADQAGQDQVERLFAEPEFLADAQQPLPVFPQKPAAGQDDFLKILGPNIHRAIL